MNKQQWINLRNSLLELHKTLMNYQRSVYEAQHGKVQSPGVMLGLLMEDKNFAWLRQLSELVVVIDEMLESKEPVLSEKLKESLVYIKKLLKPSLEGNNFEVSYFHAIQKDPHSALMHGRTSEALEAIII